METIAERLKRLRTAAGMSQAKLAQVAGVSQGAIGNIESGIRGYGESIVSIASVLGVTPQYLRLEAAEDENVQIKSHSVQEERPAYSSGDLVIRQFETGGSMGDGFELSDHAGIIKSWQVDPTWLRTHVPVHTGIQNLCIVTGFGTSMQPMYNPGDPLLVDRGVRVIDHEGVFFFRVGNEGYIKLVQRVPEFDGPGVILRIISKNPDFPPYDLSPKHPHFEVIGKVLTVWRSEHY